MTRRAASPSIVIALGLASLVAGACGARTDLQPIDSTPGEGGSGSTSGATLPTTASTSTDATSTSASTSSAGGGLPVCTTLGEPTKAPTALTEANGDAILTSLLAEEDRAFFASTNNNDPSPDPTWRVREVADDLSVIAESQVVAKRPQSVSYSGMSLASRHGHRGGLHWDESHGCRFVQILDDGAPGPSKEIDPKTWCYGLGATETGYYAFMSSEFGFTPMSMLTLDGEGNPTSKTEVFPATDMQSFPRGRAALDDGSLLLAFSEGTSEATYFATRVSLEGVVLTTPHALVTLGDHARFAITSAGDHALAAWTSDHAPGDILVANVGADAATKGVTFVAHTPTPATGLTIRRYGDGALVAWSDSTDKSIKVARVGPTGELLSSAIVIPTPGVPFDLQVAPTSFGAIVGFGALGEGLTQVWVTALPCVAE